MHEIGHGLAGIITGGYIKSFYITSKLGGSANIVDGHRFTVAFSGYLSSTLIGFLFFIFSTSVNKSKIMNYSIASILLILVASVVRDQFTIIAILIAISYLIISAAFFPKNLFLLNNKLIGIISILYLITDIFNDTILKNSIKSDSFMLERITGFSSYIWGFLWLAIAIYILFILLKKAIR